MNTFDKYINISVFYNLKVLEILKIKGCIYMSYFKISKEAEMMLDIKSKEFTEAYIGLLSDELSEKEFAIQYNIPIEYVQNITREKYLSREGIVL